MKIGRGGSGGYVYLGKRNGSFVAVKRIDIDDFNSEKIVIQKLGKNVLANVLQIYCLEETDDFAYIVSPLMEYNLSELMDIPQIVLKINPVQLCRDVLNGLAELHRLKIIHRDIKPSNILISE